MPSITMKELLEAGVHFGHRTHRWNPKMKRYIYGGRNGIYIIDLHQTLKMFEDARKFIQSVVLEGDSVLFVGTKKQAQEAIDSSAKSCGMYYVSQRWLGGMLTNFQTIKLRIQRLAELEKMEADGVFDRLTKKEAAKLTEERDKLERVLGGIKTMPKLPGAVFIVDLKKERIALLEARKLDIPVVAIVDTNCDPDEVDYIIPGNDDAIRAIKLISSRLAEAIVEVRPIEEEELAMEDEGEVEEIEDEGEAAEPVMETEPIFIQAEPIIEAKVIVAEPKPVIEAKPIVAEPEPVIEAKPIVVEAETETEVAPIAMEVIPTPPKPSRRKTATAKPVAEDTDEVVPKPTRRRAPKATSDDADTVDTTE